MHAKLLPLLLCCAALSACGKDEAAAPAAQAPAPAPAAQTPAQDAAAQQPLPMPAVGAIDTTGLPPACVQYVQRYLACTAKMPANAAAEKNVWLAGAVAEMQSTPNSPELPRYCFNLNEEMAEALERKDC